MWPAVVGISPSFFRRTNAGHHRTPLVTDSSPPSKSRTLIWHIGWHKTGTTSIQNFFKQNQRLLHRQCGLLYPSTGLHGPGHHLLAKSLWPEQPPEPAMWRELAAELRSTRGWKTALISAEGLRFADPERIRQLAKELAASELGLRIVAYVRQPDKLIESLFAQELKGGHWTGSFAGYLERCRSVGEPDYSGQIGKWQRCLPAATVVVRPFDRSQWHGGGLLPDFCQAAGLSPVMEAEGLRIPAAVNRSPGAEVLSLIRDLNRGLGEQRRGGGFGMAQLLEDLLQRPDLSGGKGRRMSFFPLEQRRQLRATYEPVFRELGIDFGGVAADLPATEGAELAEFAELPGDRREDLLHHTLQTAVLTIDRVCREMEDSKLRADRLAGERRLLQQQHEQLQRDHQRLVRVHREVSRQYAKTLRRRMVDLRAWWRRLRKGAGTTETA